MKSIHSLLALAALCALPTYGAAQAGSCELVNSRQLNRQDMGGFAVVAVAGPLRVQCQGGTTLLADSAMVYEASNEVQLFGRVDYRDPTRTLTSNYATYSSTTGRLYATGNVVFTDIARGSTLRGPELEYFRAMAGRPQAQVIAGQRPHLTVVPAGNARNREPLQIDGDRITTVGETFFSASGNVVIHRTDLDASAAEATHDGTAQTLNLRGNARISGERFDLSGETVDATLPQNRLERVVARRDAQLASEKLRVDGPEIQLFFANDLLQRLVTRRLGGVPTSGAGAPSGAAAAPAAGRTGRGGEERPLVAATGLLLEADSVEAVLPGQVLERVIAVGRAHGETVDTAGQPRAAAGPRARMAKQPRPAEPGITRDRDWVLGDTITGFFARRDSAAVAAARTAARAAGDTARSPEEEVELERVVARGSARSFYRVREEGERIAGRPGMNYLVAREIELTLEGGELDVADARGLQRGVYLDPTPVNAAGAAPPAGAQPGAAQPGRTP
ncbi:MAG TPA: OstA-like protein, partial [Longimicrobiaceae bacterium]|nr:OstA-like protein [Longimicrobiaceae bacterium]